jgi:hypothetical protein
MTEPEAPLKRAERHVREGEARLLRQQALLHELYLAGHFDSVEVGKSLLKTMQASLALAREHLRILQNGAVQC